MSASIDVGMVLGAVLGGVVTALLGWPWVFYVIVVVGLATLAVTPRAVEESRGTRTPLNVPSALAAAGGLALLIFALTRAQAVGVGAAGTVGPLAGAAALLPVFAVTGFTFATAAVPLTAEAVADAPPSDHGIAAGLFQTFTHVGGAIVLPLVIIAGAARTEAFRGDEAAALTAGYQLGFGVAAALLLAGAAAAVFLLPGRRQDSDKRGLRGCSRSVGRR